MGRSWRSTSPLFLHNILLVLLAGGGLLQGFPCRERNLLVIPLSPGCRALQREEKEAFFSYFLRREERSKEASTLTKPSPIWEGCN